MNRSRLVSEQLRKGARVVLGLALALAAGPWGCEAVVTPDLNGNENAAPAGNAVQNEGDNVNDNAVDDTDVEPTDNASDNDNDNDNDTTNPPVTPVDFGLPDGAMVVSRSSNPPEGFVWTGLWFEIGDKWTEREPMPEARGGARAVTLGGYIYVIGGGPSGVFGTDAMFRYDPQLDAWEEMAPLPEPRINFGACAAGSRIYVVGGTEGSNTPGTKLFVYDPAQDAWDTLSDLPTGVRSAGVAAHAGKIYCAGGQVFMESTKKLQVYDIASDTWSTLADLPYDWAGPMAGIIDGRLYLVGGAPTLPPGTGGIPVAIYDIASDSWSEGTPAPVPLFLPTGTVAGGKFYAMHRLMAGPVGQTQYVLSYDPVEDKWETWASIPADQLQSAAACLGDDIYVFGGFGAQALKLVQRYTLSTLLYVHEPE